jgi:ubiquinone/menaquinone biosynthesis C-methylase UbiE
MKMDPGGLEIRNLEAFGVFGGPEILEIGCGDGRVTATLSGRAEVLAAVDPSEDALRQAAHRIHGVHFVAASGGRLPFPDGRFDTLVFTLSLHHQDSRQALREARRVVRPDGRILAMEPAADGEVQLLFHCFHDETPALAAASTAIEASALRVLETTQFEADWEFADRHEFSRYMFAYHDQARNPAMETRLFRQLGAKADMRPLVLKDRIRLFLMTP